MPFVGSGSGGSGGLSLLFNTTLGADAASLDTGANGIVGGHGDLLVVCLARSADAAGTVNLSLRFNNDSGANYNWSFIRNDGTPAANANGAAAATSAIVGQITANTATASYAAPAFLTIPAYDATTFFKTGTCTSGPTTSAASSQLAISAAFSWANTAAITRLTLLSASGGNLRAGSVLRVYGLQ